MAQNHAKPLHSNLQPQAAPHELAGPQPGDLILKIRTLLDITPGAPGAPGTLSDDDIESSCLAIQARTDPSARWLTAFNSPLGRWLLIRGSDLNTQLNQLLTLLPPRA